MVDPLAQAVHEYTASLGLVLGAEGQHICINCPNTSVPKAHALHAPRTVTFTLTKAPDRTDHVTAMTANNGGHMIQDMLVG